MHMFAWEPNFTEETNQTVMQQITDYRAYMWNQWKLKGKSESIERVH